MKESVLLGFSGGIDSLASAFLLRDAGYDVRLVTLNTTGEGPMLEKARQAAEQTGLPWRVIDLRKEFAREVREYFIKSYLRGETPVPCTVCNTRIKWKTLYDTADREGIDRIATGHYARIHADKTGYYIRAGIDPAKDQSYYLWQLPGRYIPRILTPLGDRTKSSVKEAFGSLVRSTESMGVCFLQGENYAAFLRRHAPAIAPGTVTDSEGKTIGEHDGFPFYTIGQKKGFRCSLSGMAVTAIDAVHNRLTVGPASDLYHKNLLVGKCRIPNRERLLAARNLRVKIRGIGRNPEGTVRIGQCAEGKLHIELDSPAWAAAKGQSAVFYQDGIVLGGGFIEKYW